MAIVVTRGTVTKGNNFSIKTRSGTKKITKLDTTKGGNEIVVDDLTSGSVKQTTPAMASSSPPGAPPPIQPVVAYQPTNSNGGVPTLFVDYRASQSPNMSTEKGPVYAPPPTITSSSKIGSKGNDMSVNRVVSPSFENAVNKAVANRQAYENGPGKVLEMATVVAKIPKTGFAAVVPRLMLGAVDFGVTLARGAENAYIFGRGLVAEGITGDDRKNFLSTGKSAVNVYKNPETYLYAGLGALAEGSAASASKVPEVVRGYSVQAVTRVPGGLKTSGLIDGEMIVGKDNVPFSRTYELLESGETGKVSGNVKTVIGDRVVNQKVSGVVNGETGVFDIVGGGKSFQETFSAGSQPGSFFGETRQVKNFDFGRLRYEQSKGNTYLGAESEGQFLIENNKLSTSSSLKAPGLGKRGSSSLTRSLDSDTIGSGGIGGSGTIGSDSIGFPNPSPAVNNVKIGINPYNLYAVKDFSSGANVIPAFTGSISTNRNIIDNGNLSVGGVGNNVRYDPVVRSDNIVPIKPVISVIVEPSSGHKPSSKSITGSDSVPGADSVPDAGTDIGGSSNVPQSLIPMNTIGDSTVFRSYRGGGGIFFDIKMPSGSGSSSYNQIFGSPRKKEYTPSLYSIFGDIESSDSSITSNSFTGFEIRPVIGRRSKSKKNKIFKDDLL